jgi:indole-3-glycerol phosphate synthase
MSAPGLLDRILASKRDEIGRARGAARAAAAHDGRTPLDARAALARPPGAALRLVTEIKHKSPSAGPLSRALSPEERAMAYARGGATMISVLCDAPFFDGGFDHLARVRARLDAEGLAVPLLAKEFVIDAAQLDLARAHGADAVLLIVRIVSPDALHRLAAHARARGVEPLIEVTDVAELGVALDAGARLIGVNARDLDTLTIDTERAARVLAAIPAGIVAVHLSGLKGPDAVRLVASTRADAALMGEALMRQDDPAPLLHAMVTAAQC